eukprot:6458867-Amphidinium_carterae.1
MSHVGTYRVAEYQEYQLRQQQVASAVEPPEGAPAAAAKPEVAEAQLPSRLNLAPVLSACEYASQLGEMYATGIGSLLLTLVQLGVSRPPLWHSAGAGVQLLSKSLTCSPHLLDLTVHSVTFFRSNGG